MEASGVAVGLGVGRRAQVVQRLRLALGRAVADRAGRRRGAGLLALAAAVQGRGRLPSSAGRRGGDDGRLRGEGQQRQHQQQQQGAGGRGEIGERDGLLRWAGWLVFG